MVRRPFKPFMLEEFLAGDSYIKDVSNNEKVVIRKRVFNKAISQFRVAKVARASNYQSPSVYGKGRVFSERYLDLLQMYKEDWLSRFANTDPLSVMCLDIEIATDGTGSLTPGKHPIIMIGYKMLGDEEVTQLVADTVDDDSFILQQFMDVIKNVNPDIISTYFGNSFDIPSIILRCKHHNIDYSVFSRYGDVEEKQLGDEYRYTFKGRISLDLHNETTADQKLTGNVKNFRLKTIARYFGFNAIEEDMRNTVKIFKTERFKEYLDSDVNATEHLTKVYLELKMSLAEEMKLPLKSIIEGTANLIPTILNGRHLLRMGILPFEPNYRRYSDITERSSRAPYEGAIVQVRRRGMFEYLVKADFASMYPHAMMTANLSPETVKLHGLEPIDPDKDILSQFAFHNDGETLEMKIPDRNIGHICIIHVNMKKVGFTTKFLKDYREKRVNIRKKIKQTKNPDTKRALDSQQNAIKVIMNSVYGAHGQLEMAWGDLMVAVATTGICRWITLQLLNYIDSKYNGTGEGEPIPDNDEFKNYTGCIIEVDTDGLILSRDIDIDDANDYLNKIVKEQMNIDNQLFLELERFRAEVDGKMVGGRGIIYKQKNYIIHSPAAYNNVVIHGAAFKSSSKASIYDKIRDQLIQRLIVDGASKRTVQDEIFETCQHLDKYDSQDFVMSVTVKGNPNAYNSQTCMSVNLIKEYFNEMGAYPGPRTQLYYIKSETGYKLILDETNIGEVKIDYGYYRDQIYTLAEMLGIEKPSFNLTLF